MASLNLFDSPPINLPQAAQVSSHFGIAPNLDTHQLSVLQRDLPSRPPRWSARAEITKQDEATGITCGISAVTAAILRTRGLEEPGAIAAFLNPDSSLLHDPALLPDIHVAAERLHRAIVAGESILVFGDYDVDGVTSTALLVRALRPLGTGLEYIVPERQQGYGLTVSVVENAAAAGHRVILTADCGTTAHLPANRARELGIDLIITDHHLPSDTLPDALAVVNPKRADSLYPFQELSGCGVAYKLLQVLLGTYWPQYLGSFEEKFVDLVALAAIADCVELQGENRYLCFQGLKRVAQTRKLGLQALIQSSKIKWTGDSLRGSHVGFVLGPRLNAAGRLASPTLALELLLSNDEERCQDLAAQLEELNRRRQQQTRTWTAEALEQAQNQLRHANESLVTVAASHWHQGVVGLIASKMVDRFHRPALAMTIENGLVQGSGRSIDGFDLHQMVEHCRPLLLTGGGHAAACGFTLREENLTLFTSMATEFAARQLHPENLVGKTEADCAVQGRHISTQLVKDLERLEPCGMGNPMASLMLSNVTLEDVRAIGSTGEHQKWRLATDGKSLEAVWWQSAHRVPEFPVGSRLDIIFVPEINTYNGNSRIQLVLKDARPTQS